MDRLQECRVRAGLTQKQVAIMLKLSPPSVNGWEKGKTKPTRDNLQKLADLYGVTIDYLLGRSDEPAEMIEPDNASTSATCPDAVALTDDEMTLLDRYRRLDDEDKEILRVRALEMVRESGNTPGAVKGA